MKTQEKNLKILQMRSQNTRKLEQGVYMITLE